MVTFSAIVGGFFAFIFFFPQNPLTIGEVSFLATVHITYRLSS